MKTLVLCLGIMLLDQSCALRERKNAGGGGSDESVVEFIDDEITPFRHAFLFRGNELFVRVASFPGYNVRYWYFVPEISQKMKKNVEKWKKAPGMGQYSQRSLVRTAYISGGDVCTRDDCDCAARFGDWQEVRALAEGIEKDGGVVKI